MRTTEYSVRIPDIHDDEWQTVTAWSATSAARILVERECGYYPGWVQDEGQLCEVEVFVADDEIEHFDIYAHHAWSFEALFRQES